LFYSKEIDVQLSHKKLDKNIHRLHFYFGREAPIFATKLLLIYLNTTT